MELIYSASISGKLRRDWVQEESPICSLSSRNIIAIVSSSICASSCERRLSAPLEVIYEVCVCDIDRPWELHHVTSHMDKVVALEWHQSGTKLLIATSFGKCQVWEMKDYLLNEWRCVQQNNIIGEEIVSIAWLHDGMKMFFNSDKKDSVLYSEKVARLKFAPSLSHFGGKPVTGWLAVTATGLVCVTVFDTDSTEGSMQLASLMTTRSRVLLADIAHNTNGSLLLVTSDGNISSAVQCYRVSLTIDPTKTQPCLIDCRPIASFYVNCHTDPILRCSPTACITHVRYMLKESGDTVIVGAGDIDSSHVELWNLMTESVALHRLYQTIDTADSIHQIHKWMYKSSISHISLPVAIAVPQFPVRNTGGAPTLFQYVAIGYQDGSVKLVNKHTFQPMTTTNLDMGITECDGDGEKALKMVAHMADMKQTVTGAVLVGIDQYSCVYVMKAANTRDPVSQVPPQYLVAMLEYLIIAGYDWWDVQAAVRPGVVDAVIQKLRDNFCQQPVITQQLLLPRFLAVKASLYRCSTTGQQRSVDCLCRLLVHSISTLFRSLLRPKAITAAEKSPAEKLTQSCANIAETDIDKFLIVSGLDRREYHVDPATLQCLHELIQWLADLSLYLLTSLPLTHGYGASFLGLSLLHDVPVLACLRELLVVVRIWGAINPGCLPHFTCTCANFDCLALVYKLLTEVWLVSREGATGHLSYDDSLLDDCCLLQSQVRVPSADQGMFGQLDYSAVILSQQHPITFTFGEPPRHTSKGIVLPLVMPERQPQYRQKRDIIRQLTLGVSGSEPTKTCSRCSSTSLVHDNIKTATFKSATMNMWDRQWAKYCLCGGHWKLDKC